MNDHQIQMRYNTAISRANTLRQAAAECSANRPVIQAQINAITAGLEGAASLALLEKLTTWRAENDALEKALLSAASSLVNAAEAIRRADLAAARAAEAAKAKSANTGTSLGNKAIKGI